MASVVSNRQSAVYEKERQRLLLDLLEAVKQCQIRFGGRSELATESDRFVFDLCKCLEDVLNHGLRSRPVQKNSSALEQVTGMVASTFRTPREAPCFWQYVKQHLNKHELERFDSLKEVCTDVGRGRAWLRSALNEKSLNRYVQNLLSKSNVDASVYYQEWSLLLDEELNATLPDIAAGLSSIFFAIKINDKRLNDDIDACHISRSEPILAMPIEETHTGHRKKRTTKIISFENDAEEEDLQDGHSAPATCLSSSARSTANVCSSLPENQKPLQYFDQMKKSDQASHSSNDSFFQDFDSASKIESIVEEKPVDVTTLIPMNDNNIGELIVVTGEEVPEKITLDSEDSDDERMESLLNVKFKEPLKAEDVETVLNLLEEVKDMNSKLKTKLQFLTQQKKEEFSKMQVQLQALTRENEVLRHQLRKYVEAVQMLNKDGTAAHEALACLEASREIVPDREEAAEYEKKLVLVVEMHGELMEFNDRLQRVIQTKENVIKRLERELIDLRGPLPSTCLWEEGIIAVPDTWINICISSAFLTGGSSDVHHVYQVCVKIRDTEWNIYRRYSQFYSLHKDLRKEYPMIGSLDFPPKKTMGNKDSKFVEERRIRLQKYLRQVVDIISKYRSDITNSTSLGLIIPFFSQNPDKNKSKSTQKKMFDLRKKNESAYDPSQYNGL